MRLWCTESNHKLDVEGGGENTYSRGVRRGLLKESELKGALLYVQLPVLPGHS